LPFSSLVGVLLWVFCPREARVDFAIAALFLVPICAAACGTVVVGLHFAPGAVILWLGVVGNLALGYFAVVLLAGRTATVLSVCVIASSVFATVQLFAILGGTIPFLASYSMPGYASVVANAATILQYIRRPFGQFPEPSFMAGSLTLAILSVVVIARRFGGGRLSRLDLIAVLSGSAAIALSQSGSAILGLGIIVAVATLTSPSGRARASLILLVIPAAAVSSWVFGERDSSTNYSWRDRLASVQAGLDYWSSDVGRLWFGLGRGGASQSFSAGLIDLSDYAFVQAPPDIYSVLGRILVEFGLLPGLFVVVVLLAWVARSYSGGHIWIVRGLLMSAWLLVAGITITYDSAAWIWILPGLGLAHLLAPNERQSSADVDRHAIGTGSSSRQQPRDGRSPIAD
jgi:hypothetical protein